MLDNKIKEELDKIINSTKSNEIKLEPLDLSSFNGLTSSDISAMTIPVLTPSQISAIGSVSYPQGYTFTTGAASNLTWQSPNSWHNNTVSGATLGANDKAGQLSLAGAGADILVNGKSLMKLLERVEERLNLLTPNTELEAEWDELKELGDRYRELEQRCIEKAETWKKLKEMPAPQVD